MAPGQKNHKKKQGAGEIFREQEKRAKGAIKRRESHAYILYMFGNDSRKVRITVCVVKIFRNLIKDYSINSYCRLEISSEYRY